MALRLVLERTVKIKTGYVNPKLGFWFASSAFKPQLYSSLPRTDHYPLFEDIIVPRLASRRPLLGGCALYNRQQNTQLEFVRLLKAYEQSSVGTLLSLTLEAIDVGVKKKYFAKILRNASENCRLELESFQLVPNKIET